MEAILSEKHCGRCGYSWSSAVDMPARCPHCGTYHWYGESVTYRCRSCGHSWFSRTLSTPARCPKCKTRSWNSEPKRYNGCRIDLNDDVLKRIIDLYLNGVGCISIAIKTGVPLAKIIETIRASVCNGQTPRM